MADVIPPVLEGDHRVRIVKGEHRGQTQYQADRRIGGYWLVMDTNRRRLSLNEGETWEIRVMRVYHSTAFCFLQHKLLNADGEHPFVSATSSYVDRHCQVSVRVDGDRTYRDHMPIAAIDVGLDRRIRLSFADGGTFYLSDRPSLKDAPYGRLSFEDHVDGRRVHGTFWEN